MSRFLKVSRYSLTVIFLGACLSGVLGVLLDRWYLMGIAVVTAYGMFLQFNDTVLRKQALQSSPFGANSPVRNVEYLIIGDMFDGACAIGENATYVQISAPGRGEAACYEIVRHTHSILKEGGTVCICMDHRHIHDPIGIFDIRFFHPVTINRLHLRGKQKCARLPVLFAPIRSFRILIGRLSKKYTPSEYRSAEIETFCLERGYNVQYWLK